MSSPLTAARLPTLLVCCKRSRKREFVLHLKSHGLVEHRASAVAGVELNVLSEGADRLHVGLVVPPAAAAADGGGDDAGAAAACDIMGMFRDIAAPPWFMRHIERVFPCDSVAHGGLEAALADARLAGIGAVRLHACPAELADAASRALLPRGVDVVTRNFQAVLVLVGAPGGPAADARVWCDATRDPVVALRVVGGPGPGPAREVLHLI